MGTWISDTLTTGAVVTAATTTAVAVLGRMEGGSAVAPINAVSHIIWGDEEDTTDALDVPHTLAGAMLNAMAVTGWAGLFELLMPRSGKSTPQRALLAGSAVAATAYIVDYHVVPKRLAPGFEKKLSGASLFGVYATLALALAAAGRSRRR